MSNQGLRQASWRASAGTTGTYNEDFLAVAAAAGITTGTFNERMIAYRNLLAGTNNNINGAMVDIADSKASVDRYDHLGTHTP